MKHRLNEPEHREKHTVRKSLRTLLVWIAVWLFWIWFARFHHPTLQLNMLASGVLVSASAIAVHWAKPHRNSKQSITWPQTVAHLALRLVALAVVAVLIIQYLYDQLWGPDPARYDFATNLCMDVTFIAFHFALAGLLKTLSTWLHPRA